MKKQTKLSLIIHSVLFLFFALFLLINIMEPIDNFFQDLIYQSPSQPLTDIVIVAVDDQSLEELGRWPWNRDIHADFINKLSEADPTAIFMDFIFAEPSNYPEQDQALVTAAAKAGNVIMPVYGVFDRFSGAGMLNAQRVVRPFADLYSVTDSGHINTIPDNDGLVRYTLLQFQNEGDIYNSVAWRMYELYQERKGLSPININDIPIDPVHRTYITYTGEPFAMEAIPYSLVLSDDFPAEYFRDKIVMVGPYTVGIADDYYFTPLAPQEPMYGVEIHANILQMLITKDFKAPLPNSLTLLVMLIIGVLAWLLFYRLQPLVGFIALAIISILYFIGAWQFGKNGLIISVLYPVMFFSTQYVAALAQQFIAEQLEKKRITDVFGKYVAPQIVGKVLDEGEAGLQLGGAKRDVSVLFVDIRGFTPLSEAAEPEEVVAILNEYLTLTAQSIFDYGGTLDKFIGDATMALFNAPLDLENHQLRAVQTAWAMVQGAKPLQERLEKQYGKVVRFGIGIHCGPAIIGNIGAAFRMDYTAIGDTVNTAARIESNTKPGQLLISQKMYDHVKDFVQVTDLGTIQVKGKTQGVQIYQIENVLDMEKPE